MNKCLFRFRFLCVRFCRFFFKLLWPVCLFVILFMVFVTLFVGMSAFDCLERLVSKMTCLVSSRMLHIATLLTHYLIVTLN